MMGATGDLLARLSPAEKRAMLAELLQKRARSARMPYPMSVGQQALWFQQQLAPASPAYNVVAAYQVALQLDVDAARAAFQTILDRHAVLRCTFHVQEGVPVAESQGHQELDFEQVDLGGADLADVRSRTYEDSLRPFDLESGPLFRIRLYSRSPDEHVLALHAHHTVFDARSCGLVIEEFIGLYAARTKGAPTPPARNATDYADFVRWQTELLAGPEGARLAAFWTAQLQGALPALDLPYDRPAPLVPTARGASHEIELGGGLPARLQALARAARVTPFTLLLSAFQVLLHRYSGQDDIIVGTPAWGRNRGGFADVVGYCVNPIALRADLSGDPSFLALLDRNRDRVRDALARQEYPFPLVVERLGLERQPGRSPVFQVMLNYMRMPETMAETFAGLAGPTALRLSPFPIPQQEGQFDLSLEIMHRGDSMAVTLMYSTERFDPSTAERVAGHYGVLLEGLVAAPKTRISRLPILGTAERRRVLSEWNETARDLDEACLHELFEAQVDQTPDRVAVEAAGIRFTYAELERAANALAHRLRALGAGPGSLIAIATDRSTDLVVGLLGILKAGAAYLPLDPAQPTERLALMLEDAGATVLVTQRRLSEQLPSAGLRTLCLDAGFDREPTDRPLSGAGPEGLAYVIYTSGSTGRPKGVEIPHRAITNLLRAMQRRLGFHQDDVLLSTTTISFDIAALELFVPLITGAGVVLVSAEVAADGWGLSTALDESAATIMQATPSGWRVLVDSGWRGRPGLRAISGGEPLGQELASALLTRCGELWNVYGPTETTVWSTLHRVLSADASVPIGQPIDNTQVYVLDRFDQPLPEGVIGEIYIGGVGLARGYRNRPDLTAERFVELQLEDGPPRRLYRTGDLGRLRPDGLLDCLGRTDHQIKLRGYRIEPGEVEAALLEHAEVGGAAVVPATGARGVSQPPYDRLIAFVVHRTPTGPDEKELFAHLQRRLPSYMIPASITVIDALPRLSNGKLDRSSLLRLGAPLARAAPDGAQPATPTERRIAAIWQELLDVPSVGVHDNFYDLGGHSLLSIRAIARIEDAIGVRLNPHELTYQALGQIAAACDRMAVPAADAEAASSIRATPDIAPSVDAAPSIMRGSTRQPFFFGPPGEQLFGFLHLPEAPTARETGIVVCPPFGQEYIRAHRSLMLLGNRLARSGFPVLRFDYFGCGDSAGASEDGSIKRWIADIGTALDEMRKRCGSGTLCLVGLRLGGALAAAAAAARGGVDRLVLWDPVFRGDAYLDELRALHRQMLAYAYVKPSPMPSLEEILGFPLHEQLRAGMIDIDLLPDVVKAADRVLLLESGRKMRLTAVAARLQQARAGFEHRHVADQQVWLEEPFRGLVAKRLIETVVAWLDGMQR